MLNPNTEFILETENRQLRKALKGLLWLADLVGSTEEPRNRHGRWNVNCRCLIHQDQIFDCFDVVQFAKAIPDKEKEEE